MAKATKDFKKGDEVRVVLANGKLAPATITAINKNDTVNLEFVHDGKEVEITSSPFDETGKRADCWCGPAAAAETPATPPAGG